MNKNYFPPDQLANMVASIKPGECLRFDKDDDGDLLISMDNDFEKLAQNVAQFHIIAQSDRPGAEFFFHYLEHTFFPPDTEEGKEYEYRLCRWDAPFMWCIATIPLLKKEYAYKAAEEAKMRIADGVPFRCGPVIAATRPGKWDDYDPDLKKITIWFPLNCERAYTLENVSGSVSYQGQGGQQDAHHESDLRVRNFLRKQYGEEGYEQFLRRMGRS